MISGQFQKTKIVVVSAVFMVVVASQTASAGMLVDLDTSRDYPLGEVIGSKTGDHAYFSLGNGRAIKFSLTRKVRKKRATLKNLILKRGEGLIRPRPIKRRNLKW